MFFTLIAVFIAGIGGAGLAMLLRMTFRGRLPAWITPLFAGGAMIVATVSTEYTWFDNQVGNLPEGMEVIVSREHTAWYQPWTYVRPYVNGFIALDRASIRMNDALPGVQLVNLYVYGRWAAITEVPMAVDCEAGRQMTLIDQPDLTEAALGEDARWNAMPEGDPLRAALCDEA